VTGRPEQADAAGGRSDDVAERARVVSMLSHELKSPIATIKGLAATINTHSDRLSDAEKREFVGQIEHEAQRMLDAVNQAALAMKLDAGLPRLDLRVQDPAVVVREGAAAADTGDHPVEFDVEEGSSASIDRLLIAEAVRQLVQNAARYSPAGTPIRVSSRTEGGGTLIEVADGGPGVPAAMRESVFERFTDWRPAGYEATDGVGLGLFICRRIAERHGGEASLEEGPAGGTIARVRLPLVPLPLED
jgi:signal transduction histidine kinase